MFGQVKDYESMLNRIAFGTFVASLATAWWVLKASGLLLSVSKNVPGTLKIGGNEIPLQLAIPAFVIALVSRGIRLHDRVSDFFGIRAAFDVRAILLPLARGVGFPEDSKTAPRMSKSRQQLMEHVFYPYASSTDNNPAVGRHLVVMALEQWSWVWTCVEATVVCLLGALCLVIGYRADAAIPLLVAAVALCVVVLAMMPSCFSYARRQVEIIIADPGRRVAVRSVFDAL